MKYIFAPLEEQVIGRGGFSRVYKATEAGTGKLVAIKKGRYAIRIKRHMLQHEVRVLQLLQGHPAIPIVFAYGPVAHFEHIAMELLGPSISRNERKDQMGSPVKTAIRVVCQALDALEHVHSHGIVHRDIKPDNFLCSLDDLSRIKIIDFGISKIFTPENTIKHDLLQERRHLVGTLLWASLNSHDGIDLCPRDDLESLAYTAASLLRGKLPWQPRPRSEEPEVAQEIVRVMKSQCPPQRLFSGFPAEFANMLSHARSLDFGQIPDYSLLKRSFLTLEETMGWRVDEAEPLDWAPCVAPEMEEPMVEPVVEIAVPEEEEEDAENEKKMLARAMENSYYGYDYSQWEAPTNRDSDVTLPLEIENELDGRIPRITDIDPSLPPILMPHYLAY